MAILLVHGYGFNSIDDLGILSETVCRKTAKIHSRYSHIIFLGGWHSQTAPSFITSGALMCYWLIEHCADIDSNKLYVFNEFLPLCQPPRDTREEVETAKALLICAYLHQIFKRNRVSVDAVGLWFHLPRMRLLYKFWFPEFHINLIPAFSWKTLLPSQWLRILQEPLAVVVNWLDPVGEGLISKTTRERRTPLF